MFRPQSFLTGTIAGIAAALCIACSAWAGAVLRVASDRADAAWVVPIAWVWGAAALYATYQLRERRLWPPLLLALFLATRLPLLGTLPLLSDDVFRYLWEGQVLSAGLNPFAQAPSDLPGLNDALRHLVNHPEHSSIYPPVALLWFRALHALGGTVLAAQGSALVFDLAILLALREVTAHRGRAPWAVLLYALHPLPALEAVVGAHVDVLAVALTAWAIALWLRGWHGTALFAAILGGGAKLFPFLLVPSMADSPRWLREVPAVLLGGTALAVLSLPVLDAGPALFTSLSAYTGDWSFNGLFFPHLEPYLGAATRPLLLGLGGTITLVLWWRRTPPLQAWAVLGGAFVLLTPTLHPWYLLWALVPSLMLGGWGWAVASLPLLGSYLVLRFLDASGSWVVPWWLPLVTWGPALPVLLSALPARLLARPPEGP